MDLAALILAIIAILMFVAGRSWRWYDVGWGLAFLTAALICQFVHLTGHVVTVN